MVQQQALDQSGGPEQAQDQSGFLPDLSCKRLIAVVPAEPEQQPLDQSDPRLASTASARSQWSIRVVPAGPQLQALDISQWSLPEPNSKPEIRLVDPNKPRITNSNLWIKVIPAGPQPQALDRSGGRQTSTASS